MRSTALVWSLTRCSPDAGYVAEATARASQAGLANTRFEVGNARQLGFEAGSFGVVINRFTLHHIPGPGEAVQEWARALKPGGRLGIFDMFTSERPEETRQHDTLETLRDPSHVHTLPLSELLRLIGLAGLDANRLTVIDHEFDVDDWMVHCEQTEELRSQTYTLIRNNIGTSAFVGRRVRCDEHRKLFYRWAVIVATSHGVERESKKCPFGVQARLRAPATDLARIQYLSFS